MKNFLLIISILCAINLSAQPIFKAQKVAVIREDVTLSSAFKNYDVITINTQDIHDFVKENEDNSNFTIELPNHVVATLKLKKSHIIDKENYTVIALTADGNESLPMPTCVAMTGYVVGTTNTKASLTFDTDFIAGNIEIGTETYYIEPLYDILKNANKDHFICYKKSDVIPNKNIKCLETSINTEKKNQEHSENMSTGCYEAQIGIFSDYSMFLKYGTVTAVQNHNITVLNAVSTDYATVFLHKINFVITTQFIVTEIGGDPWPAQTEFVNLLDLFAMWGNNNGFGSNVEVDIAELWTDNFYPSGYVGFAYFNAFCNVNKYHILRDYDSNIDILRNLVSHELGHNFSMGHDTNGSLNYIMSPFISGSSTWAPESIASMNNYLPTITTSCLSACNCTGDTIAPGFLSCPSNIDIITSVLPTTATWVPPVANDNCSAVTLVTTANSGAIFNLGTTLVTYTATDANGNKSTCSFTVTVNLLNPCTNDVIAPVFSNCPSNISLTTTGTTSVATWTAPTATDNCGTPTITSTANSGTSFNIGTTTVSYTATDAKGNKATCSFSVTLNQNNGNNFCTNPIANVKDNNGSILVTGISTSCSQITLFTSNWSLLMSNQYSGTSVTIPNITPGNYIVKVKVLGTGCTWPPTCESDVNLTVSNNTNPCTDDIVPPVLSGCPSNINLTTTGTSATATWTAPKATDNCGTPTITSTASSGASFNIGTTTVTYTATDAKGNKATCSFTVTVAQNTGGNFCTSPSTNVKDNNGSILVTGITTSCSQITVLTSTWTQLMSNQYSGTSVTIPNITPGNYIIKVKVLGAGCTWPPVCESDVNLTVSNNTNPCTNDIVPPVLSACPTNINLTTSGANAVATWTAPTATDNCGTPIITSTANSGTSFNIGTTIVTYTAMDAKGNKTTCSFNVKVSLITNNLPDLTLSNLNPTNTSVVAGNIANFKFDLKNIGAGNAAGNFNIKSYLSKDNVLSADDIQDGNIPTGNIAAGQTITQVGGAMTIAANTLAGTYYIISKADADNQIIESNENNNVIVSSTPITVTNTIANKPDLSLTLSAVPLNPGQWKSTVLTLTITNSGTLAATGVKVDFINQSNTAVSSILAYQTNYAPLGTTFDNWLGIWNIPIINPGQSLILTYYGFTRVATTIPVFAQVKAQSPADADSNPGNNTTGIPIEDDEVLIKLNNGNATAAASYSKSIDWYNGDKDLNLQLYPNPTEGTFSIYINSDYFKINADDFTQIERKATIFICNTLGIEVFKKEITNAKDVEEVSLDDIPSGSYFVRIEIPNKKALIKKLMILK